MSLLNMFGKGYSLATGNSLAELTTDSQIYKRCKTSGLHGSKTLSKGDAMSFSVAARTASDAMAGAQFLVGQFQAGTVQANQLDSFRAGTVIVDFGSGFLLKNTAPTPIMADCPCTPEEKKTVEKLLEHVRAEKAKGVPADQYGSWLSLLILGMYPQLEAAILAWIKRMITPTPTPPAA